MPDDEVDRLTQQFLAEAEREAQRLLNSDEFARTAAQLEAEAEVIAAGLVQEAQQAAATAMADLDADDDAEQAPTAMISRRDYVHKENEPRYLTRDHDGLPTLRLVDAGDRLAIWSPVDGGGLINPKGPGLRTFGLCSTYARGARHLSAAFRAADLSKGRLVELRREPENPHDANAVAMHEPGASQPFGYVQRGRAAAVARRLDGGEVLAGVCLWGPPRGRSDDTAFLVVGSAADLRAMLGN